MNFPLQLFFNHIDHDYRATILKKNYLWLFPFCIAAATLPSLSLWQLAFDK